MTSFLSLYLDLYKTSIDQIPEIVQLLKSKGYTFHTAAGCHSDDNPHKVTDPALAGEFVVVQNAVSKVEPEMPEAPPKEAPETEDVSPLEEVNEGDSLDQIIEAQNNGQTTSAGLRVFSSSQKYLYSFVSLLPFIYYFA
jgi:hypothetical protein